MSGRVLSTISLKDGRRAELAYVVAGDAPAVLEYAEAIAAETDFLTFGQGEFGLTLEQEVAFIESLADRSQGLMLKATVADVLAGTAVARRSTRPRIRHVAELGLSVRREFWGSGIGRALCRTLFEEAQQVGVERIALRVRADNTRAIRLYESLGFVHEGRVVDVFRVAGVSYDELVMSLRI
jgi:RimJ/RimL family protein N-acetyltransferase